MECAHACIKRLLDRTMPHQDNRGADPSPQPRCIVAEIPPANGRGIVRYRFSSIASALETPY